MSLWQKRMRPLLGCFVEIALPKGTPPQAYHAAFQCLDNIHQLLSFHNPNSDLSRLNLAQGQFVQCHPLSIQCLRLAKAITQASGGRFNCTLGAAIVERNALPNHDFHEPVLNSGDESDLEFSHNQVKLRRPVLITLDGIAKGFAVDKAVAILLRVGISSGWINAGGDIRAFGEIPMPISVKDHTGKLHPLGYLQNAAMATSTSVSNPDYPGLLLDTTLQPLPAETFTVLAHRAWRADALTKVAATTPVEERMLQIAQLGGRWVPIAS